MGSSVIKKLKIKKSCALLTKHNWFIRISPQWVNDQGTFLQEQVLYIALGHLQPVKCSNENLDTKTGSAITCKPWKFISVVSSSFFHHLKYKTSSGSSIIHGRTWSYGISLVPSMNVYQFTCHYFQFLLPGRKAQLTGISFLSKYK